MRAFIDSLKQIKVIQDNVFDIYKAELKSINYSCIPLSINKERDNNNIISLIFGENIPLNFDLDLVINDEYHVFVELGFVTKTDEFNELYKYDGPLGVTLTNNTTIFRVWSPVAKEIILVIDDAKYPLSYYEDGLWSITINKNLLNKEYYYKVRVNKAFIDTIDPYSYGVTCNAKRSIVLNEHVHEIYSIDYINPLIYELSIRDATSYIFDGTYSGLEKSQSIIDHIKSLGTTHVEFLPTYNFGGINEEDYQNYNWGYNPISYFSLSNYLAKDKGKGTKTRDEFIKLIDTLHKNKLNVILDVVCNHVYNYKTFAYEIFVPAYSYFYDMNGILTNASWCGNDLNTNHYMIRRMIKDNLMYLLKTYNIDGFRFDLMGNVSASLIEEAKEELLKVKPNLLILGEGWDMSSPLKNEGMILSNAKLHPDILFFNDEFRNTIRGNDKQNLLGFANGKKIDQDILYNLFIGSSNKFNNPNQSVNYIECHDNYTFYDLCKILDVNDLDIKNVCILALSFTTLSFGTTFIHAGSESLRTKKLIDNSYNQSDFVNSINWMDSFKYKDIIDIISTCKKIKDSISLYNENNYEVIKQSTCVLNDNPFIIKISLDNDEWLFIFKNDNSRYELSLDSYYLSVILNNNIIEEKNKTFILDKIGISILKR